MDAFDTPGNQRKRWAAAVASQAPRVELKDTTSGASLRGLLGRLQLIGGQLESATSACCCFVYFLALCVCVSVFLWDVSCTSLKLWL